MGLSARHQRWLDANASATWVDADVVRGHVQRLRGKGVELRFIVAASGVAHSVITGIARGEHHRVLLRTAAAILAVPCRPSSAPTTRRSTTRAGRFTSRTVDGTGTRRRVQALAAEGWSWVEIARRYGTRNRTVGVLSRAVRVSVSTEALVRRVFEDMRSQSPPGNTPAQRASRTEARNRARLLGWHPIAAWPGDSIDDPSAHPQTVKSVPRARRGTEDAEVAALAAHMASAARRSAQRTHLRRSR